MSIVSAENMNTIIRNKLIMYDCIIEKTKRGQIKSDWDAVGNDFI